MANYGNMQHGADAPAGQCTRKDANDAKVMMTADRIRLADAVPLSDFESLLKYARYLERENEELQKRAKRLERQHELDLEAARGLHPGANSVGDAVVVTAFPLEFSRESLKDAVQLIRHLGGHPGHQEKALKKLEKVGWKKDESSAST